MAKTYYLHTLNGLPAGYVPGRQICFAMHGGKAARLCGSLREIKMQRRFSEQWRKQQGYEPTHPSWFGYRRVLLP
jgi:hypothetical protein